MLIALTETRDNERGPLQMEKVLDVLHQTNASRLPVSFEYGCFRDSVGLYCRFPPELKAAITQQLATAYPDSTVKLLPDDTLASRRSLQTWSRSVRLRRDIFPFRRHAEFTDPANRELLDPVATLLAALPAGQSGQVRAAIRIEVRPCRPRRQRQAQRIIQRLTNPFFRNHPVCSDLYATFATCPSRVVRFASLLCGVIINRSRPSNDEHDDMSPTQHNRETSLEAAKDKIGRHLFEATIHIEIAAPPQSDQIAKRILRELIGAFGAFSSPRLASFRGCRRSRRPFLLSTEELATLWHPPLHTARAPRMEVTEYRRMEPPRGIPTRKGDGEPLTELGETNYRDQRQVFGLKLDDRRRHLFVVGKTGMGKSTLLANMLVSDIRQGRGVGLIDPHGDLAEQVLQAIPRHRTNDVVYFDAGDREFPIAFNPLACHWPEQRPLVAAGVLTAFKKLFGDSWGPRMEHILRNALLALLETPGTSLVHLSRLLQDSNFRRTLTGNIDDPLVRAFWQQEFASWNDRYRTEAIAPVLNKLGFFLSNVILRNVLGQQHSSVNLRSIMDSGQVLIVNLSKGRIGEDASTLLGSLLINSLQLAAMSRADISEDDRQDFCLYVDEFQNFATESFATILSEARKYRLSLTVANQYLAQMEEAIADAVFGNVGSLLSFQVGAGDGEVLAEQLGGDIEASDVMSLPKYTAYVRLLVDGLAQRPFSMETITPAAKQGTDRAEIVRQQSRNRYARPVRQVEAEIAGMFGNRDQTKTSSSRDDVRIHAQWS